MMGLERRLRRAWIRRPSAGLRGLGALYGLGAETRHFLYDTGTFRVRRASIPILSVGGLTVGGSGKTPLAAELARWLQASGCCAGIITRGYPDELDVHRILAPGILVLGHPRPIRAVQQAARRGVEVVVLDDGFQHRGLFKDLDILLVDADALLRTNRRRLPAGPFRDGLWASLRADAIVVTHRSSAAGFAERVADHLARPSAGLHIARCALVAGKLVPVNRAAASRPGAQPVAAVAGIMKPKLFLETLRAEWPEVRRVYSFRDHEGPNPEQLRSILQEVGDGGLVGTLKDTVRLASRIGERTPIWYLEDRVVWEAGKEQLHRCLLQTVAR